MCHCPRRLVCTADGTAVCSIQVLAIFGEVLLQVTPPSQRRAADNDEEAITTWALTSIGVDG